jgi:hypothetical protein
MILSLCFISPLVFVDNPHLPTVCGAIFFSAAVRRSYVAKLPDRSAQLIGLIQLVTYDNSNYSAIFLGFCSFIYRSEPIPVDTWSTAWVCSRSLAGITGSNPAESTGAYILTNVVYFTMRGLCGGLIIRPEESYRVCTCHRV